MPIPNFQSIILPLLKMAGDRNEHHRRIVLDDLASHFPLTDEEREEVTEKRGQNVFDNRCDFALNFLRSNGLLRSTGWGSFKITERGIALLEVLKESPEEIKDAFSKPSVKIIDYLNDKWPVENENDDDQTSDESNDGEEDDQTSEKSIEDEEDNDQTPEESIEENYQKIREDLAAELLEKIKNNKSAFFEKLVIDLLVAMGYGGSWEDAGEVTGGPGDGGIDGIINQDKLGLEVVGVQAKLRTRDNDNIAPSTVNEFVGALRLKGLSKGVIITTAGFSSNAKASAERSDNPKIVLIDGNQLAQYMIDHNVGVSTAKTYEIKRVDSDYFPENTE